MAEEANAATAPPPRPSRRAKRLLIGLAITLAAVTLLGASIVGYAEHRTSQSQFCASCHNMTPYYESWQADLHGGKLDVACVECHYAPGERTTLKAKFRGLSQVASYFSGRYGATRPRAHVSNDSCLTARCHGDLKFMDKPIQLGTVQFVHARHIQRNVDQEKPNERRLADLREVLRETVGAERLGELEAVASESGPATDRYDRLAALARGWNAAVERHTLVEFSQLLHRGVRIAQLGDLQCTNCHSYHSPSAGSPGRAADHHFSVQTTTCFTCHFNNEAFNTGTNSCLMCHSPPQGEIIVHKELTPEAGQKLKAPELTKKPVKMNHADILAQKVDCIACHADVARDDSTVTRRDCERCHDQPRFFDDWKEPFTLQLVASYHKAHVKQQRAKCLDCHTEIKHRLVHDAGESPNRTFLTTVLSDCAHCHVNPHTEQVKLLLGQGGQGISKSEPNPMFGARTNCFGCHTETADAVTGEAVMKGTQKTCVACHGERYGDMFEQWKTGVGLSLADAETALLNARKALGEAAAASPAARKKAEELLAIAEADFRLVKQGNGIHNVTYAMELLDSVSAHCQRAIEALGANSQKNAE
jgi:nitrate/TMAO reductase-like tetraheme cytochrome c subunit